MRRGIGLAWLIVVLGYCIVSILGMGVQSPWTVYGLITPPLLAIGIAIILFACREPDMAGGIFIGLASIFGMLVVLVIILMISFVNDPPRIVNGWK